MEKLVIHRPFPLEAGGVLASLEVMYHTYGTLNADGTNCVWVFHALTANSDCCDWWAGLMGPGCAISPGRHFIVCANIIGSCYGSSGPLSMNPATGGLYYSDFPMVTIRDMVRAHMLLRDELGIRSVALGIGGSMGGYQLLQWAAWEPQFFQRICPIATSAAESAWGIAIHAAQRLAIEADRTWREQRPGAGEAGLAAARGFGMVTYRSYGAYVARHTDTDGRRDGFNAESYIRYQGKKLTDRFNAQAYYLLTKAMDSHAIAPDSVGVARVLSHITAKAAVVGISSDLLCPLPEQRLLAQHLPDASLHAIDSPYGHDGFLVETEALSAIVSDLLGRL